MTDIPVGPSDLPPEPPDPSDPPSESEAVPPPSLLERLGPRAVRRMTPRIGVALAGAGALIAIGGAIGLGGDNLVDDDGDVQRIPGILIALVIIAAGYAVMARIRTGPLASAGATAAALGVPVLLFFLTFSVDDFPPFSLDAILLVSSLVWIGTYLIGPGAGRLLFLGAALAGSWLFVLNLIEPIEKLTPFGMMGMAPAFESSESGFESSDSGFDTSDSFGEPTFDDEGNFVFPDDFEEDFAEDFGDDFADDFGNDFGNDFSFETPDLTDVAVVSLGFGLAYAIAALVLTRRGYHGAGTPFTAVGILALVLGIQVIAPDLEQVGTGLLAIAIGLFLAASGAASHRRATAWIGAAFVGFGAIAVMQKGVDGSSATAQSLAFLFLGLAVVCAAHLISVALDEPDEEDLAPSTLRAQRAGREPGPPDEILVP